MSAEDTNRKDIITSAVERLNHILPLTIHQQKLDAPLRHLHRAILCAYIDLGRSLTRDEMASHIDDVDKAIDILKRDELVLFDDNGESTGAYPFSMEQRGHRVMVNNHTVHCMCALDALAVSPMFNLPTKILSHCHVTHTPISIHQQGRSIVNQNNTHNIHFGINWGAAAEDSCCANSLCTEMIFLKDESVAENWLAESVEQRQIFPLHDAIEFAARFFVPLMED